MWAQILIGAGISFQLLAFVAATVSAWQLNDVFASILSLGAAGAYVWAFLKWNHAQELPTQLTTFRSWKVNFVCFWTYIGVTLLNILLAYPWFMNWNLNFYNATTLFLIQTGPYIGAGLGASLIAGGIFLGWRIKQLWLVYDPERSLAYEPFDYFVWEDEEPVEQPTKTETDTTIEDGKTDSTNSTDQTGNNSSTDSNQTGNTTSTDNTSTNGTSTTTPKDTTGTTDSTTTTTGGSTTTTTGGSTSTSTTTSTDGSSTTSHTSGTTTHDNSNSNTTTNTTTTSTTDSPKTTTTTDSTTSGGIRRRKQTFAHAFDQDSFAVAF
jgi:hypothetical protein